MISGTLLGHNCFDLDYCVNASLDSLLDFCHEVVFGECDSTDLTGRWINERATGDVRIRNVWFPWKPYWKSPPRQGWLGDITNALRAMTRYDYHFQLQADEVVECGLSQKELEALTATGNAFIVERLNFWKDHRHLLPPDKVCSSRVLRLAPRRLPVTPDIESIHSMELEPVYEPRIRIFHYGFIRRPESLVKKARFMEQTYFAETNPLWHKVEQGDVTSLHDYCGPLLPYDGTHPKAAHQWLSERGYAI